MIGVLWMISVRAAWAGRAPWGGARAEWPAARRLAAAASVLLESCHYRAASRSLRRSASVAGVTALVIRSRRCSSSPTSRPPSTQARDRVDAALRHRALRRQGGAVAAEVSLRSAVASAALEGHAYDREEVRAGTVTDPVVQGALRVAGGAAGAGRPVAAGAAAGAGAAARAGRPGRRARRRPRAARSDPSAAPRLDALASLVAGGTSAPPLLLAAVVHGELLALRAVRRPGRRGGAGRRPADADRRRASTRAG